MTQPDSQSLTGWRLPTWGYAVAAAMLCASLTACGSTDAAPAVKPELVWVDGPPFGALESDEWVRAVRDAEFALAWASNEADFTLPEVRSTWDNFSIDSFATSVQADLLHGTPRVYLGPAPVAPVAVQVDDDGKRADVAACVDAVEMLPSYDDGNDWPLLRYYSLELTESGERRMARGRPPHEPFYLPDGSELTDEYCKTLTIPRAVFNPAPDLEALARKDRDDVLVPPLEPVR